MGRGGGRGGAKHSKNSCAGAVYTVRAPTLRDRAPLRVCGEEGLARHPFFTVSPFQGAPGPDARVPSAVPRAQLQGALRAVWHVKDTPWRRQVRPAWRRSASRVADRRAPRAVLDEPLLITPPSPCSGSPAASGERAVVVPRCAQLTLPFRSVQHQGLGLLLSVPAALRRPRVHAAGCAL
jgi:hypothetical protein